MIPLEIKYKRYRIDENDLRELSEKHRPKVEAEYCDVKTRKPVKVYEPRHAGSWGSSSEGISWA